MDENKFMSAKELIEKNTLKNISVGEDGVVFASIAETAVNMAHLEEKEKWEKATGAFIKDAERVMKEKAISAFKYATEGYFIIGGADYTAAIANKFIEKLNE